MRISRRIGAVAATALTLVAVGAGTAVALPPPDGGGGGGGGGGGTPAPPAQKYKLHLISLYCESTEDWTGPDEPYLLVNGVRVWGNASMNDRESEEINVSLDARGATQIRLFDEDAGWFDDDDPLGVVTVGESQIDQGVQFGSFTDDGANYTLVYTVEKA